jgi:hypothetical protein
MPFTGDAYAQSFQTVIQQITFYGMLQGAGAAAPVYPTNVVSTTSSKGFMQKSTNIISPTAADTTRAGTGSYTTKVLTAARKALVGLPPIMLDVTSNVWGPSGTWASNVDYNPTTGVLTFLTFAAGGAAADLAATEFVHFTFTAQNTTPFT